MVVAALTLVIQYLLLETLPDVKHPNAGHSHALTGHNSPVQTSQMYNSKTGVFHSSLHLSATHIGRRQAASTRCRDSDHLRDSPLALPISEYSRNPCRQCGVVLRQPCLRLGKRTIVAAMWD